MARQWILSNYGEKQNVDNWNEINDVLDNVFDNKEAHKGNNFLILSGGDNDYIQTVFHVPAKKWRLEYREPKGKQSYLHFYARPKGERSTELVNDFHVVKKAFESFFKNQQWQKSIVWERLDI